MNSRIPRDLVRVSRTRDGVPQRRWRRRAALKQRAPRIVKRPEPALDNERAQRKKYHKSNLTPPRLSSLSRGQKISLWDNVLDDQQRFHSNGVGRHLWAGGTAAQGGLLTSAGTSCRGRVEAIAAAVL